WVVARRIDDRSVIISAPQTVRPGEWVDLAAVWNGREFTLFLDGKKQEITNSAFPVEPTEGGLFLGGVPLDKRMGNSWFEGAISQFRITRGILHETDYRPEANYSLSSDVVLLCDFRQKENETNFEQTPLARQTILRGAEWKPLAKAP
ncbi:MAG TPA: LamG-like jellyroll fold domain-containing protein, partial [Planctomycetaceae bacterium]|nr:LamG-like jellyroll fold domain-containing protein [Planctomycetaceae bacterium]